VFSDTIAAAGKAPYSGRDGLPMLSVRRRLAFAMSNRACAACAALLLSKGIRGTGFIDKKLFNLKVTQRENSSEN
jgi:hypothetical protein